MERDAGTLARLDLTGFRGLANTRLELDPRFNLLSGGNAAGKTSILEAIFLLGRGQSFRSARLDALIAHGEPSATVFAELRPGAGPQRLGVEARRVGGLETRVDGSSATRAQLATALPVQLLDPGSQELVRGGPEERRRFLDWGVFHVEQNFLDAWQQYRRALDQRNAALRQGASDATVRSFTEPLVQAAELVDRLRRAVVATLAPRAEDLSAELLGGPQARVDYHPGWNTESALADLLDQGLDRDRQFGSTQSGPHRADLRLRLDDRLARQSVSRGQEKLLSAALALGQVAQVAEALERTVVLLVDEPAADLDRTHLARLLKALRAAPAQVLLTTLDTAAIPWAPVLAGVPDIGKAAGAPGSRRSESAGDPASQPQGEPAPGRAGEAGGGESRAKPSKRRAAEPPVASPEPPDGELPRTFHVEHGHVRSLL